MTEPRCGAHCGLDKEGLSDCVKCELHGLCHMCVEEDWARRFAGIKKDNVELRKKLMEFMTDRAYMIAIEDRDQAMDENTRLIEILKLIHSECDSLQTDIESLVTCVNLAAKGLGMDYDDSIYGGRGYE